MGNHVLINSYPVAEVAPGVYEIDEFDCASAFLVVGDERALLDPEANWGWAIREGATMLQTDYAAEMIVYLARIGRRSL